MNINIVKNYAIKKIIVTSICFILLLLFYFIPTKNNSINENKEELTQNIVYLVDNDGYVSLVMKYFNNRNILDEVNNRMNILLNSKDDNFHSLIPFNTKINNISVDKNNVYIDFSKELLNVKLKDEEKMIESIIYTLSEINGIDNIYLSVDNNELRQLPNSKLIIPYPLNKNFGINKEYNLYSFNNFDKIIVFFLKEKNGNKYYVPVTKYINSEKEKIEVIIEELKSSINSQYDLKSLLNGNIELLSFKIEDNTMYLLFNKNIFDNEDNFNDLKYIIKNNIFSNYNIEKVVIKSNEIDEEYIINKNS